MYAMLICQHIHTLRLPQLLQTLKTVMESTPIKTPPVENLSQKSSFGVFGEGNDQPGVLSSPLSILSNPVAKAMINTVTSLLTTALKTQPHNAFASLEEEPGRVEVDQFAPMQREGSLSTFASACV